MLLLILKVLFKLLLFRLLLLTSSGISNNKTESNGTKYLYTWFVTNIGSKVLLSGRSWVSNKSSI